MSKGAGTNIIKEQVPCMANLCCSSPMRPHPLPEGETPRTESISRRGLGPDSRGPNIGAVDVQRETTPLSSSKSRLEGGEGSCEPSLQQSQ